MKFIRFISESSVKIGCISNSVIYDLSSYITNHNISTLNENLENLNGLSLSTLPIIKIENIEKHLPSVASIGKIICIGGNSKVHNNELDVGLKEPMFFFKPTSTISSAMDDIPYTKINKKLDWEAELAVIIGKKGKNISINKAMDYVFGYSCFNDLSDRHWQFKDGGIEIGGQVSIAKCFDGFAPLGPLLVTKDEISNPSNLSIELKVNDVIRQKFNSSEYIWNISECISNLSKFMTLNPGDIIALGSGPGNAKYWGDEYLKPGDSISLHIEGMGTQRQIVIEV